MSTEAQPKKKSIWPWIIVGGLLILGAALGYVYWKNRKFLNAPATQVPPDKPKPKILTDTAE